MNRRNFIKGVLAAVAAIPFVKLPVAADTNELPRRAAVQLRQSHLEMSTPYMTATEVLYRQKELSERASAYLTQCEAKIYKETGIVHALKIRET